MGDMKGLRYNVSGSVAGFPTIKAYGQLRRDISAKLSTVVFGLGHGNLGG